METNSSCDQTNFLGYHPPSQISNGGWEYHQEFTDSKHSNPWRCTLKPQDEQDNHMGYFSPPQNDSSHYSNGGWEYHQGMKEHEYLPEPQNDSHYDDSYTNRSWEGNLKDSCSIHQETSSLEYTLNKVMKNYPPSLPSFSFESSSSLDYASTQSFLQNPYKSSYQPQNSSHNSQNSFHTPQHNFTTTHPCHENYSQPSSLEPADEDYLQWSKEPLESQCQAIEIHRQLVKRHTQSQSWKEILFKKMNKPSEQTRRNLEPSNREDEDQFVGEEVEKQDEKAFVSSEISMKNEVVEVFEPELAYSQKPLEMIKEHESSQPPQTSLNQRCSTLIERYEEEMKKSWEEQQTSSMKVLLKQMLSVKEEVEEQESEKNNQGRPNSSEAEKCKEEGLMEPPIQEALNEDKTPIITQQPSLESKGVKAIDKSTKKRIVTKTSRTTFKKRSTANNPPPDQASKLNQANFKRKLAERRPRQGTIAETSPPLRSFLLTNWKKRKKVKNR
ncbi:hypothetical protein AHAS_Ahas05G0070800 [Arachis hypogaea]